MYKEGSYSNEKSAYDAGFRSGYESRRHDLQPVPLLLHCPLCNTRHVDKGEFATRPHHTHACQQCGHVWRPALVFTVGVQFLPGFRDTEDPGPAPNECRRAKLESGGYLVGLHVWKEVDEEGKSPTLRQCTACQAWEVKVSGTWERVNLPGPFQEKKVTNL